MCRSKTKPAFAAAIILAAVFLILNARADITTGLVGHWTFDDGSGSATAADTSGNNDTGALTGFSDGTFTSMWDSGRIGGSLLFATNGDTGDLVSIPNQSSLNFSNGLQFTLSAWVRGSVAGASQVTGATIIAHGYSGGGEQYSLGFTNAGKFQFLVRNASGTGAVATSATVPASNTWYHITAVYSGQSTNKQQLIYINGVSNATATAASQVTSLQFASTEVSIGNRSSVANPGSYSLGFKGDIDDVHIYNRALTSNDVYQLYASNGRAPIITTQPRGISAYLGDSATFTVAVDTANSIVPIGYQWQLNGTNITGATSTTLTVANTVATNAGTYTVVITNYVGTTISTNAVLALQALPAVDASSGLVGYWKFDDGSGSSPIDSSLSATPSSLSGTVLWTNGLSGTGLAFNTDGSGSDVMTVPGYGTPAPAVLDFSGNPVFTLSAWVRGLTGQTNGAAIIAKGTGGGGEQYVIDINTNAFRFYVRDSNQVTYIVQTAVTLNGNWQHVAAVLDATRGIMDCYVNGALVGVGVAPFSVQANAHEVSIGNRQPAANNYGDAFTGNIDEVHVYNRALTSADVFALYHLYDPEIIGSLHDTNVNYQATATFSASVITVHAPVTFAWYFGSTLLSDGIQADGSTVIGSRGANSSNSFTAILTLTNVTYLGDGSYVLYLTNQLNGVVSSFPAALTVNEPFVATQPSFTTVIAVGGSASIPLAASGPGLSYQWYNTSSGQLSDGGDIFGTATSTLIITNAQMSDAGTYYAIITGTGGSVQSSNAIVYVQTSQLGPFDPANWPPTVAANGVVDYAIFDPNSGSFTPPPNWNNVITLSTGTDAKVTPITFGGLTGDQGTATYFNFADPNWQNFANTPVIDILLQVYGNSSIYTSTGAGVALTFQEGQLNYGANVKGVFPLGANNSQWNWMLFEITNAIDPLTGYRYVGDTSHPTQSAGTFGGVNSGTIRVFGGSGSVNGITIRAVAMGPQGAFGTPAEINRFATTANCPSPATNNLAFVDFNKNITNNLTVLSSDSLGEQLGYQVQTGVGPANDLRTAIQSTSYLMNFAISNNYLGQPCNGEYSMQLCIEFYDDPNAVGTYICPYQFATDPQGDLAYYGGSSSLNGNSPGAYKTTGTGQWLKLAFFVGPACLQGVGTAPLTGGPTLAFLGTAPMIDRIELGVIQTGTNALAGQIPDPNYHMNPLVCATNYGYYAEWDPNDSITNNVTIAAGYTGTIAGPANDQRICEKTTASGGAYYLAFALQNSVFGPLLQDNCDLQMVLTYYDDPAAAGNTLEVNTYSSWIDGISSLVTVDLPVTLQGSGQWKDAYFEIPDVNFTGAQVCRYAASAPMYISRVRYNVIRPCGTFQGIDYLQSLGMTNTAANFKLNWRGSAVLQSATSVTGSYTNVLATTNSLNNTYSVPTTNTAGFYRLQWPGYPAYLSPYGP